jgi:uncharacterized membrane protein YfcA
MSDPSATTLALLALAGLAAGFVDAVVGGGGLLQLPALLVGLPHAAPVQILGTNKLSSICGTTVSSATYYRRIRPDPRTFGPLMVCAFAGSVGGALLGSHIPDSAFDPIVLVVLVWSAATSRCVRSWARARCSSTPAAGTSGSRWSPAW